MKAFKYRNGHGSYNKNGKSLFYRDVESLVHNKIYAPTVSELNDPNENNVDDSILLKYAASNGDEAYKDWLKLKEMLSKMGIYSLSSNSNNELLWSYYASGHHGFVIEYDLNYLIASFDYSDMEAMSYFIDINYSTKLPKIKGSRHLWKLVNPNEDFDLFLEFYLGNKSKNWKHEDESRIILEKNGLIEYDYRSVSGIYFGYRMEVSDVEYMMDKMKGRGIRYYQMKLGDNYNLEAYAMEDKFVDSKQYILPNISYDPLFLSEDFLKENYSYKEKIKEAIEIVCSEPLVKEIIGIGLKNDNKLVIVIMAECTGIYPLKKFPFMTDNNDKLYLIEDISTEIKQVLKEAKGIKYSIIKETTAANTQ